MSRKQEKHFVFSLFKRCNIIERKRCSCEKNSWVEQIPFLSHSTVSFFGLVISRKVDHVVLFETYSFRWEHLVSKSITSAVDVVKTVEQDNGTMYVSLKRQSHDISSKRKMVYCILESIQVSLRQTRDSPSWVTPDVASLSVKKVMQHVSCYPYTRDTHIAGE